MTRLFLSLLFLFQAPPAPPYVQRGDQVEQQFREYHERLTNFYKKLHNALVLNAPELVPDLEGEPPRPVVYGYQLIPKLFDEPPDTGERRMESRNYSWPLTETYIRGEEVKLDIATLKLNLETETLRQLVSEYRVLVDNQKTIDQHVEYNRFWQRAVDTDRKRYDQLTEIFNAALANDPDVGKVIREVLGTPEVPSFIRVARSGKTTVLHVPVYSDIDDDAFLAKAKTIVEEFWQARDGDNEFRVEVEWRKTSFRSGPKRGDHINLRAHADVFPKDGAVLTTGAESTHAFVGRFVALGSADTSYRTIAHEFGHILGFRDGYIRGYKNLGKDGYEVMELTPNFDDLMSAPRTGRVLPEHFQLLLAGLRRAG